jgi:hypothetical protein
VKIAVTKKLNWVTYHNLFSLPEPSSSSKCGASGGEDDQNNETINRDQVVYEYFSKRFEQLFQEKSKAESKVLNYITEVHFDDMEIG